ncbi:tyrosinase [Penicillium antarcticum]|uniref:tyrosinase n=1 Tax=Penicillium antarcticum TaxID=416450 RepID=UPI00238CCF83|nr:tyrosinase [Penicillium antarcticum]KAJ5302189.1 tyrosinase [Penicillium antarcticum]
MRLSILSAACGLAACAAAVAMPQSHSHFYVRSTKSSTEERLGFFTGTCTEKEMTVRKEWRNLSKTEQNNFLDAVQCLMDKPPKSGLAATTSRFSDLQALHRGMSNTAYADIIHHVDGRFSNYTLHIGPGDEDTNCLQRAWNAEMAVSNANSTSLDMCNAYNTYSPWWDWISNIPHKGVHTYIGGVMADIKSSPDDPIFFMHHMYVDRVWWLWQKKDPVNRHYDINGPTLNENANVEPAGG